MKGENARPSPSPPWPAVPSPEVPDAWDVVDPDVLASRPARAADFRAEAEALKDLSRIMAETPGHFPRALAERILSLCEAGSAVVTLPEADSPEGPVTGRRAAAGALARQIAAGADAPEAPVVEALFAPLSQADRPAGAVWILSHDPRRRFDPEDRRRLESLAAFAGWALATLSAQADGRASAARLKALAAFPGPIVFRAAVDGAVLEAPGWETLTGQPPGAHLGWGWLEAVHPLDRAAARAAWSRTRAARRSAYTDFRLRDAGGAWRWVRGYGAPVRDEAGDVVEWVGALTDIQDLHDAETALRRNEAFLRFAAEAGGTGAWSMRLDTLECVFSPLAARQLGLPEQSAPWPAEVWNAVVAPEDRDALHQAIRSAILSETVFEVEFRIRRTDGTERWLHSRGAMARGAPGEPPRLHGVTLDVTDRKASQIRRLAIIDLADRLRDHTDPGEMTRIAASVIGRALEARHVAFGVLDLARGVMTLDQAWTAPGAQALEPETPLTLDRDHRDALDLGEPIIVPPAPGTVIYRPFTAAGGPPWVLRLDRAAPRAWTADELAFAREGAERTRAALERLAADADLRARARRLEGEVEDRTAERDLLWRNSRDLLAVMDRTGGLRAVNPAWLAVLGWPPGSVVGCNFIDFVQPDDRAAARDALAAIAGADAPGFETRHTHRDGGVRWVAWVAAPRDDLIFATGRHITAEKVASEAVEETQARLRTFFETTYQYRALISPGGLLLDVNTTALEGAGISWEAVVGLPLWATPWFALTPGVPDAVRARVARVAAGETQREDIHLKLPGLGWRWFDFTLRPLRDGRGTVTAIVLEAVDITERRMTEAALRQSQKLDAMGRLTGGVAHDFNNLLTPIIGSLDLLQRRRPGSEREQRLIAGALQSAERAKSLVQRLLAVARRQPLQAGAVDVAGLIAGMRDLVAGACGPRIRLTAAAPADLPPAHADANQLEMAILNLSMNARDAMPEGGSLRISAACETAGPDRPPGLAPGRYIRLSVADTGVGMDEATLARAVEPFFSTKGQGRGTGLGLSMAHGLALQLGGALTLASQPGQGTEVELWLPVSDRRAGAAPAPDAPPAPAWDAPGRVLLVDDDALARASTADMLADLGYGVVEADSAQAALALMDAGEPIDLLVTDYLMPDMTGAELADAARRRGWRAPILVITGYAETLPAALPQLNKPFRLAELAAGIAAAVAGGGPEGQVQ
jgi:PAS domain S-box-containing protein